MVVPPASRPPSPRLALALIAPAGAQVFGVSVSAQPASTLAAAHQDFTLDLTFTGGGPKDVDVHLPPGLLRGPAATPRCSQADFTGGTCPPASRVGTTVTVLGLLPATGEVFNVEPPASDPMPARLGVVVRLGGLLTVSRIPVAIRTRLTDYGLDSAIRGLPNLPITAMSLTLLGRAGGNGFMANPTSCDPATTRVDVTPQSGAAATGSDTFTPTDCAAVPFTPSPGARVTFGVTARRAGGGVLRATARARARARRCVAAGSGGRADG